MLAAARASSYRSTVAQLARQCSTNVERADARPTILPRSASAVLAATLAAVALQILWPHAADSDDPEQSSDARNFTASQAALPSFEWADASAVVRLPKLFSAAEIAEIHAAADRLKPVCGQTSRDAHGVYKIGEGSTWTTTYLHTQHNFQRTLPHLYSKLLAAAQQADRQEGWGLLAGNDKVHPRCIEYHEGIGVGVGVHV